MNAIDLETAIKVLKGGKSWHGGSHRWSLPMQTADGSWTPGEWTPAIKPEMCSRGYHLTTEPARWWGQGGDVFAYLAEYDGETCIPDGSDKIAVERCRLLRPLTDAELVAAGVYLSGHHETVGGAGPKWIGGSATVHYVGGSATVEHVGDSATVGYVSSSATVRSVGDSATVRSVGGSATVARVSGSATVHYVGDSATVGYVGGSATVGYVGDSATVHYVGGSATVEHVGDSATVGYVGGSATVHYVGGSATVERVGGSATVHAYDQAVVVVRYGRPTVTTRALASALDYRSGRPAHRLADAGMVLTIAPDGSVAQTPEVQ